MRTRKGRKDCHREELGGEGKDTGGKDPKNMVKQANSGKYNYKKEIRLSKEEAK